MRYDPEADVLTVVISEGGRLSHAEEVGDIVLHLDEKDRPLLMEILNASKVIPAMVRALARREATREYGATA